MPPNGRMDDHGIRKSHRQVMASYSACFYALQYDRGADKPTESFAGSTASSAVLLLSGIASCGAWHVNGANNRHCFICIVLVVCQSSE